MDPTIYIAAGPGKQLPVLKTESASTDTTTDVANTALNHLAIEGAHSPLEDRVSLGDKSTDKITDTVNQTGVLPITNREPQETTAQTLLTEKGLVTHIIKQITRREVYKRFEGSKEDIGEMFYENTDEDSPKNIDEWLNTYDDLIEQTGSKFGSSFDIKEFQNPGEAKNSDDKSSFLDESIDIDQWIDQFSKKNFSDCVYPDLTAFSTIKHPKISGCADRWFVDLIKQSIKKPLIELRNPESQSNPGAWCRQYLKVCDTICDLLDKRNSSQGLKELITQFPMTASHMLTPQKGFSTMTNEEKKAHISLIVDFWKESTNKSPNELQEMIHEYTGQTVAFSVQEKINAGNALTAETKERALVDRIFTLCTTPPANATPSSPPSTPKAEELSPRTELPEKAPSSAPTAHSIDDFFRLDETEQQKCITKIVMHWKQTTTEKKEQTPENLLNAISTQLKIDPPLRPDEYVKDITDLIFTTKENKISGLMSYISELIIEIIEGESLNKQNVWEQLRAEHALFLSKLPDFRHTEQELSLVGELPESVINNLSKEGFLTRWKFQEAWIAKVAGRPPRAYSDVHPNAKIGRNNVFLGKSTLTIDPNADVNTSITAWLNELLTPFCEGPTQEELAAAEQRWPHIALKERNNLLLQWKIDTALQNTQLKDMAYFLTETPRPGFAPPWKTKNACMTEFIQEIKKIPKILQEQITTDQQLRALQQTALSDKESKALQKKATTHTHREIERAIEYQNFPTEGIPPKQKEIEAREWLTQWKLKEELDALRLGRPPRKLETLQSQLSTREVIAPTKNQIDNIVNSLEKRGIFKNHTKQLLSYMKQLKLSEKEISEWKKSIAKQLIQTDLLSKNPEKKPFNIKTFERDIINKIAEQISEFNSPSSLSAPSLPPQPSPELPSAPKDSTQPVTATRPRVRKSTVVGPQLDLKQITTGKDRLRKTTGGAPREVPSPASGQTTSPGFQSSASTKKTPPGPKENLEGAELSEKLELRKRQLLEAETKNNERKQAEEQAASEKRRREAAEQTRQAQRPTSTQAAPYQQSTRTTIESNDGWEDERAPQKTTSSPSLEGPPAPLSQERANKPKKLDRSRLLALEARNPPAEDHNNDTEPAEPAKPSIKPTDSKDLLQKKADFNRTAALELGYSKGRTTAENMNQLTNDEFNQFSAQEINSLLLDEKERGKLSKEKKQILDKKEQEETARTNEFRQTLQKRAAVMRTEDSEEEEGDDED